MNPSHDRLTFVIPSVPADLTAVDAAAQQVANNSGQDERATVVGLKSHSQISKREGLFTSGVVDSYTQAWPGHYLLRIAKASPVLSDAICSFLRGDEVAGDEANVERDLSTFGQAAARELAEIMQDAADGIDRIEAAKHRTSLQHLQELISKTIADLDRRARGDRGGKGAPRRSFP